MDISVNDRMIIIRNDIYNNHTNKHIDQLTWDCSNLTKVFGSTHGNAVALNTCWESFAALMVLLDLNLD